MRGIFLFIFLLICISINNTIYANGEKLYYVDLDGDAIIDNIIIEFSSVIYGTLDMSKIDIYSSVLGGNIDSVNIINNYKLKNNNLILELEYIDKLDINKFKVDNTLNSDFRIKTLKNNGLLVDNKEINLTYSKSFDEYKNIQCIGCIDTKINIDKVDINKNININFQTPSDIVDKDINLDKYVCNRQNDICRINFNLLLDNKDLINKYSCKWDFGLGYKTGEEEKCNPNTIEYPIGQLDVYYSVYINDIIINHKNFIVVNDGSTIKITASEDFNVRHILQRPSDVINSEVGLSLYECNRQNDICRINFNLELNEGVKYSQVKTSYRCEWDFGLGYKTGEEEKCNPNTIEYPIGEFNVYYSVYNKEDISRKYTIYIRNKGSIVKIDDIKEYIEPIAKITHQQEASYKIVEGNSVKCIEVDECNINLDGRESIGDNLEYVWDMGNGQSYNGDNPPSFKYTKGNYTIILTISDDIGQDIDTFNIEVEGKPIKEKNKTKAKLVSIDDLDNISKTNTQANIENIGEIELLDNKNLIIHIWLIAGVSIVFLALSFILLKKNNII